MEAEFIEEGGYYLARYAGLRTYPVIIALLEEVAELARSTGVYRYLFDLRKSDEGFSVADKYELGNYLGQLFGTRFTVAVLLRKEHITGFLENVSINRGAKNFTITDDEEKAKKWVSRPKA